MPAELNQVETTLLALGVSLGIAALLALGFLALKWLSKFLLTRVILIIKSK